VSDIDIKKGVEFNHKIQSVLLGMGLSFLDCIDFVVYDEEAETAYWSYNRATGEESIHIGTEIAGMDNDSLEMVLRHEILHRSTYHGFLEHFEDSQLSNITLDICINRLLFETYPDKMRTLSEQIYTEESKCSIIALADCSAGKSRLSNKFAELWSLIWEKDGDGFYSSLNPTSLYYRLTTLRSAEPSLFNVNLLSLNANGDTKLPPEINAETTRKIDDIIENINKNIPPGSSLGGELSTFSISSIDFGTSNIDSFLRNIKLRRIADKLVGQISKPWIKETNIQTFPLFPTKKGYIFMALGLSEKFFTYYNQELKNPGVRMAIGLYMDVSGSMIDYIKIIAHLIKAFKEYPLRLKTFDTEVYTIDVKDVLKGKITGGGLTNFDKPILDFIDDPELEAGVLFTDGDATVSDNVGRKLRESSKRLYAVYFLSGISNGFTSILDRYATGKTYINVTV